MTPVLFIVFPLAWAALPAMLWHRVPRRQVPPRAAGRTYFLLRDAALAVALLSIPAMARLSEVPGPRALLPLWVVVVPLLIGQTLSPPRATSSGRARSAGEAP